MLKVILSPLRSGVREITFEDEELDYRSRFRLDSKCRIIGNTHYFHGEPCYYPYLLAWASYTSKRGILDTGWIKIPIERMPQYQRALGDNTHFRVQVGSGIAKITLLDRETLEP